MSYFSFSCVHELDYKVAITRVLIQKDFVLSARQNWNLYNQIKMLGLYLQSTSLPDILIYFRKTRLFGLLKARNLKSGLCNWQPMSCMQPSGGLCAAPRHLSSHHSPYRSSCCYCQGL